MNFSIVYDSRDSQNHKTDLKARSTGPESRLLKTLMIRTFAHTIVVILIALLPSLPGVAEEGGSGRYFPGSMSSFVDGVPAKETVILRLNALTRGGNFLPSSAPRSTRRTRPPTMRGAPGTCGSNCCPTLSVGGRWSDALRVTFCFLKP